MPTDPAAAEQTMIRNLETSTGRGWNAWLDLARTSGKAKHGELVAWLKAEHGLTHGYANLVAHRARGSDAGSKAEAGEDLVGPQYAGDKAALKPLYDAIAAAVQGFGPDVELAPKKAYVSLRRSKQFGLVQPSTKARLDLGLVLKGVPPAGRLEAAGSWNAMVTHRVRLAPGEAVDRELVGWLRQAYDAA